MPHEEREVHTNARIMVDVEEFPKLLGGFE
jgi:hypothetical protein